jgi:molybdopterin biosynthesis enzyme
MVFAGEADYLRPMSSLTPLRLCLDRAMAGLAPVAPAVCDPAAACGQVLAADLTLPHDLPPVAEALRAGVAVAALDLVGASPGAPVPLGTPVRVVPGMPLPPGTDAVLPEDGTDGPPALPEAVRPVGPGEGVRRAGHDGRAGDRVASAGMRLAPHQALVAALAGIAAVPVRRPRVAVALADPAQAAFARAWAVGLGAVVSAGVSADGADLTLRSATAHTPRLALAPAETAWLERSAAELVLTLPARFDGMVAALLGLGLPALAALSGATPRTETRPLARKIASGVGVAELVLLARDGDAWLPQPAGTLTLSRLAAACAFAILPPDSEGLPAGAPLSAHPLDLPFG